MLAVKQAPVKDQRELQAEDVGEVVKRSASMCMATLPCSKVQVFTWLSQTYGNAVHMQTRFKPKVVARRKADPDEAADLQARTSAAPENDAFKDLIVAVSLLPLRVSILFAVAVHRFLLSRAS